MIRAVVFDVDFTLIHPGPTFQGTGYQAFSSRYGIVVDPARFPAAVASASSLLDLPDDTPYADEIHVRYTRHILEVMGGTGDRLDDCAREIYREWAACHHFDLYDDVPAALRDLMTRGVLVGLVSNSHRSLDQFQRHFGLDGLIAASVSSAEHGRMKPHPSIFEAVLDQLAVPASRSLMVGDSVGHDVEGALRAGMHAALLHRPDVSHPREAELVARGVPVLRTLRDLSQLL